MSDDAANVDLLPCYLGACDVYFSVVDQVLRILVLVTLAIAVAGCAAYLSPGKRALASVVSLVLAYVLVIVLLPFFYPYAQ
jgi:hypothetical protein